MGRKLQPIRGAQLDSNGKHRHRRPNTTSSARPSSLARHMIIIRKKRRRHMAEAQILAEQFDDLEQQQETAAIGMWTFLATEVLFFGGLFLAYIVYRTTYPQAFAEGSHHNNLLLGSINTAVLLT